MKIKINKGKMDNSNKIILDLCGGTGSWSKSYKDAGYDVRLITLPEYDIFTYEPPRNVYGILAAPTCTHFSFCRTNAKEPRNLQNAMLLVKRCLNIIWQQQYKLNNQHSKKTSLKFWALENPRGFLEQFLGKPALEFSPYEYGDDYKKTTHIWGNFNVPPKINKICDKTKFDKTLMSDLKLKHPTGWVYDKGCGLSYRGALRSITPQGFARAFFNCNK